MVTAKRSLAEIDADIAAVKHAIANVRGSETEVYARIVGYYRSVRNWNKGKRDEYNQRKQFVYGGQPETAAIIPQPGITEAQTAEPVLQATAPQPEQTAPVAAGNTVTYAFFARNTCPNCPPVKEYLANSTVTGIYIDVDSSEGIARAAAAGVFSAPTVIVYDEAGTEIARAHDTAELDSILKPYAGTPELTAAR